MFIFSLDRGVYMLKISKRLEIVNMIGFRNFKILFFFMRYLYYDLYFIMF